MWIRTFTLTGATANLHTWWPSDPVPKVLILSVTIIDIQDVNTEDMLMISIIYYQYDTVSSETWQYI